MPMNLNALTAEALASFEGKGPGDFCTTGLNTPGQNHCAHFVCHAIGLKVGRPLCGDMKYSTRHTGVTMRVNDVFNYCTVEGFFEADGVIPAAMQGKNAFFVIATIKSNLEDRGGSIFMMDNPHKHIGIWLADSVWNFSNGQHLVVRDEPGVFFKKMRRAYGEHTTFVYAYRQDI
jgi:hypothetical protein